MKILFIASDKAESAAFPPSCHFVYTGVGQALATSILAKAIIEERPDMVVNVGTVGAITKEIGEVLEVKQIYNLDQDLTSYRLPRCTTLCHDHSLLGALTIADEGVTLATSSAFSSAVKPCMETLCIDICDMEAYSEALLCKTLGIEFKSFKVVTDIVGVKTKLKDYKAALKASREELASFVLKRLGL